MQAGTAARLKIVKNAQNVAILLVLVTAGFGLSGCDGWPTTMRNQGVTPISFAYWHDNYAQPSAAFELDAGQSTLLAREHRLRDLKEIRVVDDEQEFVISGSDLDRLKEDCRAYQCILTYAGEGRLSARPWTRNDAKENLPQ